VPDSVSLLQNGLWGCMERKILFSGHRSGLQARQGHHRPLALACGGMGTAGSRQLNLPGQGELRPQLN
jgi:hypothetical protein